MNASLLVVWLLGVTLYKVKIDWLIEYQVQNFVVHVPKLSQITCTDFMCCISSVRIITSKFIYFLVSPDTQEHTLEECMLNTINIKNDVSNFETK